MSKLTIIICYNNTKLLNQLKSSIVNAGIQPQEIEWMALDNTNQRFTSAAEAYNYALKHVKDTEVIVFCHQDIILLQDSLKTLYELCIKNPYVLFGSAGVENVGHGSKNRIISSMAMIQEGWNYKTLKKGTTKDVFTIDECLFGANSKLFQKIKFNEKICDGWHLYAVELSLQCQVKGYPVRVFDANIVHLSGGNQDKTFYDCEKKIVKKYRKDFTIISYCCGWAYTNPLKYFALRTYRRIKYDN